MKKAAVILVCMVVLLSFAACETADTEQSDEREAFVLQYEKELKRLDVLLSPSLIEDEEFSDMPLVTDRIQLPDSETMVSLDRLRDVIHVYELQTGESLQLTAEDIVELYSSQNEEKQAEFEKLYAWYMNASGQTRWEYYTHFACEAYVLYRDANGKPFVDKKYALYTSEEKYALAQWALENIDYDHIEKILNDPDADYVSKMYVTYLHSLGLIDSFIPGFPYTVIVMP